jgi:hypothetical protein
MGFCTDNARLRRLILTRTDVAAQFLPNFTFSRGWAEIAYLQRIALAPKTALADVLAALEQERLSALQKPKRALVR